MRIVRFSFDKDELLKLPPDDRALLISLGHAYDELNALGKVLYWSAGGPGSSDAEKNGRYTMMLLFMRLLAGKLHESWGLFRKLFFARKLSKDYEPGLDKEASQSLAKLKRYFNKKNSVSNIRNNYAFHYSPDEIDAILPDVKEPLEFYLSGRDVGNNLYYSSELLAAYALLQAIGEADIDEGYSRLVDELFEVAVWFTDIIDGIIAGIVAKFGGDTLAKDEGIVEFEHVSDIRDIHIPWFTSANSTQEDRTNSP